MDAQNKNMENVFIRNAIMTYINDVDEKVSFRYEFSSGAKVKRIPVYYTLYGDKQLMVDAFANGEPERRVDFQHDDVPRIILNLNSVNYKMTQTTNPHVRWNVNIRDKDYIAKVRWLPVDLDFTMKCVFSTQMEIFKFIQTYVETFYYVNFIQFQHVGLRIKAAYKITESFTPEKNIEGAGADKDLLVLDIPVILTTKYPVVNYDTLIPAYQKIETVTQKIIEKEKLD